MVFRCESPVSSNTSCSCSEWEAEDCDEEIRSSKSQEDDDDEHGHEDGDDDGREDALCNARVDDNPSSHNPRPLIDLTGEDTNVTQMREVTGSEESTLSSFSSSCLPPRACFTRKDYLKEGRESESRCSGTETATTPSELTAHSQSFQGQCYSLGSGHSFCGSTHTFFSGRVIDEIHHHDQTSETHASQESGDADHKTHQQSFSTGGTDSPIHSSDSSCDEIPAFVTPRRVKPPQIVHCRSHESFGAPGMNHGRDENDEVTSSVDDSSHSLSSCDTLTSQHSRVVKRQRTLRASPAELETAERRKFMTSFVVVKGCRQSDSVGAGVIAQRKINAGECFIDPFVKYYAGHPPPTLDCSRGDYIKTREGYLLLNPSMTEWINEPRGDQQENIEFRTQYSQYARPLLEWKVLIDVAKGEEILALYNKKTLQRG